MKNSMVRRKIAWVTVLAVALSALLVVTACAPSEGPLPGQKNVVEIGAIPCLTGGGGTADQPSFRATQDYVRYFNEKEGIPGVTSELEWRDNQTNIPAFISAYRGFVDSGIPLLFSNYPTPLEGLVAQLEKDQVPFVTGGPTGALIVPPGWVFCAWATQGESAAVLLDYFMDNWTEESPPKLQLFVLDELYGRDPAAEATTYAESIGYEVLPLEVCPHVVIDATPQLIRIQGRGADLVYIQTIISGAGPIMRDVERLGLQDEMQFAGTEWVCGDRLMQFSPAGTAGFLSPRALPWFDDTGVPGVVTMVDKMMEYHGEVTRVPEAIAGWVYGAILCEAASRAVAEVGVENVDGPAMKRALESFQDFDVDGMAKFTFGPEDRRGDISYAVCQIQGGKIVRVTDYRDAPVLVR
jgi:ABC-type branched-subunit amino acid transport system substrate-binding protein